MGSQADPGPRPSRPGARSPPDGDEETLGVRTSRQDVEAASRHGEIGEAIVQVVRRLTTYRRLGFRSEQGLRPAAQSAVP